MSTLLWHADRVQKRYLDFFYLHGVRENKKMYPSVLSSKTGEIFMLRALRFQACSCFG